MRARFVISIAGLACTLGILPGVAQAKDWYIVLPKWAMCAKTDSFMGINTFLSPDDYETYLKSQGALGKVVSGPGPDGTGAVEVEDTADNETIAFWGSINACEAFLGLAERNGFITPPSGQQ